MDMELNTVLELVKAGFTKDEIMQMELPRSVATSTVTNTEPVQMEMDLSEQITEPKPVQAQVAEPVAVAKPIPVQGETISQESNQPTMADLMQGIAKLTSAVQANAIAQSVLPQGGMRQPTAEDMLAEIIRPTFKERS